MRGPTGIQGPQGDRGSLGITGLPGADGAIGPKGETFHNMKSSISQVIFSKLQDSLVIEDYQELKGNILNIRVGYN